MDTFGKCFPPRPHPHPHVDAGMPAEDVAAKVLASVRAGDLFILSHNISDVLNLRNRVIKHGGGLEPLTALDEFR